MVGVGVKVGGTGQPVKEELNTAPDFGDSLAPMKQPPEGLNQQKFAYSHPWHAHIDITLIMTALYITLRRLKLHGQNHTKCTQFGPCKEKVFHRLCFSKTEY